MMRVLFLLVLFAISNIAQAVTYTVSWTNPTQYTDGSPLDISLLSWIKVYCGATPVLVSQVFPIPSTTSIDVASGSACYVTAVDIIGTESTKSNTVTLQTKPKPPTQFKRGT